MAPIVVILYMPAFKCFEAKECAPTYASLRATVLEANGATDLDDRVIFSKTQRAMIRDDSGLMRFVHAMSSLAPTKDFAFHALYLWTPTQIQAWSANEGAALNRRLLAIAMIGGKSAGAPSAAGHSQLSSGATATDGGRHGHLGRQGLGTCVHRCA